MLQHQQKIIILFIVFPLTILLVNSFISFQFIIRYHHTITSQIDEFHENRNDSSVSQIVETSQTMINQFRMVLTLTSIISILLCAMTGVLVGRQFTTHSSELSGAYLRGELNALRDKIDRLITVLEKQE